MSSGRSPCIRYGVVCSLVFTFGMFKALNLRSRIVFSSAPAASEIGFSLLFCFPGGYVADGEGVRIHSLGGQIVPCR